MKLELKHLAPYLPYGLKAMDLDNGSVRTVTLLHFTYDMETVGHNHLIYEGLLLKKHQPILKPLSDLDSGNVEGLFYSEWLIEKYHTIGIENQINRIEDDIRWINYCDYILIQHLLEWHFDVFGLIEKGLAIDINTI